MNKKVLVGLVVLLMAVFSAHAQAEEKKLSAEEILKLADQGLNKYSDQYMKIKLTVRSKTGERQKVFEIYQKGAEKRLIRFLSPGDVKGMGVVIPKKNVIYVYLPKMHKVRRVAAHNLNQGFAGSDFTQNDMAVTSYVESYVPSLDHEDAEYYYLKCVPKPHLKADYDYAIFKIDKKEFRIWEITYYKGKAPIRRMTMRELTDFNGEKRPKYIEMTNLHTKHSSLLEILEFKVNLGLKDSMFTPRYLQWGR